MTLKLMSYYILKSRYMLLTSNILFTGVSMDNKCFWWSNNSHLELAIANLHLVSHPLYIGCIEKGVLYLIHSSCSASLLINHHHHQSFGLWVFGLWVAYRASTTFLHSCQSFASCEAWCPFESDFGDVNGFSLEHMTNPTPSSYRNDPHVF